MIDADDSGSCRDCHDQRRHHCYPGQQNYSLINVGGKHPRHKKDDDDSDEGHASSSSSASVSTAVCKIVGSDIASGRIIVAIGSNFLGVLKEAYGKSDMIDYSHVYSPRYPTTLGPVWRNCLTFPILKIPHSIVPGRPSYVADFHVTVPGTKVIETPLPAEVRVLNSYIWLNTIWGWPPSPRTPGYEYLLNAGFPSELSPNPAILGDSTYNLTYVTDGLFRTLRLAEKGKEWGNVVMELADRCINFMGGVTSHEFQTSKIQTYMEIRLVLGSFVMRHRNNSPSEPCVLDALIELAHTDVKNRTVISVPMLVAAVVANVLLIIVEEPLDADDHIIDMIDLIIARYVTAVFESHVEGMFNQDIYIEAQRVLDKMGLRKKVAETMQLEKKRRKEEEKKR